MTLLERDQWCTQVWCPFHRLRPLHQVEGLSETSEQASLLYADGISYSAGTMVTLTDDQGNVLLEATAIKVFEAVTISTSDMVNGESYTLTVGSDEVDFTINSIVTMLGSGGMTWPGGGGLPPRP